MKLLSVLGVSHLIVLTAASAATDISTGSSIFGSPVAFDHPALMEDVVTAFDGSPFTSDYNLQYFPESSLADSTPYNGHNLFGYNSSINNRDTGAMNSNDAGVQGWTPFLQTHFGSYNVIPEPGTFALFGLASLAGVFWFRRKD